LLLLMVLCDSVTVSPITGTFDKECVAKRLSFIRTRAPILSHVLQPPRLVSLAFLTLPSFLPSLLLGQSQVFFSLFT
jgi:hypothetical protein